MVSPLKFGCAVVDLILGPPKPKHSCRIHERFRAIPHKPNLWMHPRWSIIPFTGQRPITGSTALIDGEEGRGGVGGGGSGGGKVEGEVRIGAA